MKSLKLTNIYSITRTFTALLALGLITQNASAQTFDPEEIFNNYFKDWYQVEIIIFERIEKPDEDPEAWPKNLSLSYPPRLAFLIDPAELEIANENQEQTDENGSDAASENSTTETPSEETELLETLQRASIEDPLNKKYRDAVEKSELERLTPKEKPWHLLESDLRSLNHEAKIIGRDRVMRVLRHSVWRQPMTSADKAPSIVITGGDLFGDHYELEGTIKLHVSRYLHLQSDLWLTQFEANVGQKLTHWPALPKRPEPIIPDNNEESGEANENDTNALDTDFKYDTDLSMETTISESDLSLGLGYETNNNSDFNQFSNTALLNSFETEPELASPYVTQHIVSLKQNRRMRSGELHYIDHPKLGIILRLEKYEPEYVPEEEIEKESDGAQEAGSAPGA